MERTTLPVKEIVKIVIDSTYGHGPLREAYKDRLVITPMSIEYESNSTVEDPAPSNVLIKWSYKEQNETFATMFDSVAEKARWYLTNRTVENWKDIGTVTVCVVYDDKNEDFVGIFCPKEYYKALFKLIEKMIPACEKLPKCLVESEDDLLPSRRKAHE